MNRQTTILVITLLIPMAIDFQTRLTFFQLASPRVLCLRYSPPALRSRDRPKNKATMTDTSALSSTGSLSVANGVMDVPPIVARRPHLQDARRRWRIARSIAWAMQMRCLQTPSHHGALAASPSSPRPRRACGRTQTRPAVPYAVRPCWERGGAAQRTGTHVSTALGTTGSIWKYVHHEG